MHVAPFMLIGLLAVAGPRATSASPTPVSTPPAAAPMPTATPAADGSEYRVGSGDVLDIVVLDEPALSRTAVVQTNGRVSLPLLGEVPVAALTVPEIKTRLTTLLADYLLRPQVEVKIKDYQSQFATVIGEVNNPGRKPLRERTRLVDVLLEAGGFTPRASGDVTVSRREGSFAGGETTLQLRLGQTQLSAQDEAALEIFLRRGDLITAAAKSYVTVEGEVARPGRYVIEPDLTVSGALSLAGGLTRYGSHKLTVRRTDPRDGSTQILKVDLKDIRNGKKPDLRLQAEDVITVDRSLF